MTTYDILSLSYPDMVSVDQLASITGMSPRTFRSWLRRETMPIPVKRLGGVLRFRLYDVAAWIDGQRFPSLPTRRRPGRPKKADQMRQRQEPK